MNLKAETMGLALAVELPLVITDIQRAGPSTGMPTKTEQADLHDRDVRPPRRVAAADHRRHPRRATASTPRTRRFASP
jgi:2-oxoglutarate ferredoxin oxidoreductase subunit alpha